MMSPGCVCCQVFTKVLPSAFQFFSLSRISARCLLSANVIGQGRSKEEFCRSDLGANQMNAIQAYLNILDNTDATLTRV